MVYSNLFDEMKKNSRWYTEKKIKSSTFNLKEYAQASKPDNMTNIQ